MNNERLAAGLNVRQPVLGDAHVDQAVAGTTDLIADLLTPYA
jgi:hypothetical protein